MSALYSSFQSLPVDIVKLVLDHVFYFDARSFALANNNSSPRSKRRSLSILHSCHIWRTAFIERSFNSLTLGCSIRSDLLLRFTNDPYFIDPLFYPTEHLVKSLVIDFRRWRAITSGDAIQLLAGAEQLGLMLTSVQSLKICVSSPRKPLRAFGDEPMDKLHNIVQFLGHVRRMIPNVRKVDLSFHNLDSLEGNHEANALLFHAIEDLLSTVADVKLELPIASTNAEYKLDLPTGLVCFTCNTIASNSMWHIEVVRCSANTLRELEICRPTFRQAHGLIYHDTDRPVIYPSLKTLKIGKRNPYSVSPHVSNNSFTPATSESYVAHFPSLVDLCLPCDYPFDCCVLLNDKCATVERLTIVISSKVIHGVSAFNYIADTMSYLKDIMIEHESSPFTHIARGDMPAISDIFEILQKSSPKPKRFEFLAAAQWSDLYSSIPVVNVLSSITCLNIPYITMIFADIVVLLEHAPNLSSLTCSLSPNLPKHVGVHPRKMPSYVKAHVFPIGPNLRILRDISDYIPSPLHAYKTAALLAIACPNLAYIDFPEMDSNIIRYGIDTSTNMGEYVNHTRRLKMLCHIK